MARGGKRVGAGRPAGASTRKTREIADKAAEEGVTPLDYMLAVMRDEDADEKRRDAAAQAAAPYIHPKLSTIEHSGRGGGPIKTESVSDLEFARRLAFLLNRGAQEASGGQ